MQQQYQWTFGVGEHIIGVGSTAELACEDAIGAAEAWGYTHMPFSVESARAFLRTHDVSYMTVDGCELTPPAPRPAPRTEGAHDVLLA